MTPTCITATDIASLRAEWHHAKSRRNDTAFLATWANQHGPALLAAAEKLARYEAAMGVAIKALEPFASLSESAKAAFSDDRVSAGNVRRGSVSFGDFENATAALAALARIVETGE